MHTLCKLAALACALAAARVDAVPPRWGDGEPFSSDLGLAFPRLLAARAEGAPLPRATAFRVSGAPKGVRIEDRFPAWDLWYAHSVRGCWRDAGGNRLTLARLDARAPDSDPDDLVTRTRFYARLRERPLDPKDAGGRDEAVAFVSPVDVFGAVRPRRSRRQTLAELVTYATTNEHAFVAAFRPRAVGERAEPVWYAAILEGDPADDAAEQRAAFDAFLDRVTGRRRDDPPADAFPGETEDENGWLRFDYARSVANDDAWHFAASDGACAVDDLDGTVRAPFLGALTNQLVRLRAIQAKNFPTPMAGGVPLACVRVFRDRVGYLAYAGEDQAWTGALWSPVHRELVLYHDEAGTDELLASARHESFHQYLFWAGAMQTAAPWFNEGHAQLFERAHFDSDGRVVYGADPVAVRCFAGAAAEKFAALLPAFLKLDYAAFYDERPEVRALNYALAWSVAYFLEVGAPNVRFAPWKDVRADYVRALVATGSMEAATDAALPATSRAAFAADWLAFWKDGWTAAEAKPSGGEVAE